MNPTSDYDKLRWCDRHKNTQVYHHVEAFAKKIRKRKNYDEEVINANAQQRQIDVFYKVGWQYQHAHSSLTCDISDPIYIQNNHKEIEREDLAKYLEDCNHFISRLKTEHEDETAFRVETKDVEPLLIVNKQHWQSQEFSQDQKKHSQNLLVSKQIYKNLIQTIKPTIQKMLKSLPQRFSNNEYDEINEDYPYMKIKEILNTILYWTSNYQPAQEESQEIKNNMYTFMANFINVSEIIRNEKRSCVFNIQPEIETLTYLIHPVLLGLYGFYQKQKILWKNEYEHNILNIEFGQKIEGGSFVPDPSHFEISRTVFINLDGYESEFNLEFAKNMQNHLMYISFPKFDKSTDDHNLPFNNRFLKKLLFNYSREMYQYQAEDYQIVQNRDFTNKTNQQQEMQQQDQINMLRKELQLKYDPQRYFYHISNMYKNKTQCEINKNIFIFPLCFKYLQQQLSNLFGDNCGDATQHESYFVDFILKEVLFDQIRKFNPHIVVISYNGNICIKDQHWVKMLRELATVTRRKMMLFPNFTTKLVNPGFFEEGGYEYDNFIIPKQKIEQACNTDLMHKFSEFLKIGSGTYNLVSPRQKESLIPRYKIAKLHNYIRGLLKALSYQQFPQLKDKISDLILRCESIVINRSIQENIKEIKNAMPPYYQLLTRHIRQVLLEESDKYPNDARDIVQKIREQLRALSAGGQDNRQKLVADIIQKIELQITSQKYAEIAYVYLKTKDEKREYEQLKEYIKNEGNEQNIFNQTKKDYNNLSGLYQLSFRYTNQRKEKSWIPISKSSEILYKIDHRIKMNTGAGKKTANIMVMNHLEGNQFISYAGLVTLNQQSQSERNKISSQRVQLFPITFQGTPQLNFNSFFVRGGWTYTQTSTFYILYWPQQCSLIEHKLRVISDEIYEPRVLNQIYVCEVQQTKQHRLTFRLANTGDQRIVPRRFTNSLHLPGSQKIFIMGGFYQKEYNYLSLQTQITGFDLSHFTAQNPKCILTNQKRQLYPIELPRRKTNSYVRARREYQYYDIQELYDFSEDQLQERNRSNTKTFYMIGGYGQDFVRPYSLMSCNYYVVDIDTQTQTIKSVQKKMVYQKLLTSNIKGYIKNSGYFEQLSHYEKNSLLRPDEAIGPQDYVAHRSVYCLKRQQGKPMQLQTKTKYQFALNLYNNYKKQYIKLATKIGQYTDTKTRDTSQFFLSITQQGNHYVLIRQNKNKQWITQIYFQKKDSKSKFQKVSLTHGSIISIDIKFKHILALIKHDLHTEGKCILAHCQLPSEQSEVLLRIKHVFNENLQQHSLFIPRQNEVLLLHGITFNNVGISDYLYRIPKKQTIKQISLNPIKLGLTIDRQLYKKIYTIMIKDENKQTKHIQIQNVNVILPIVLKPQYYGVAKYKLKVNTQVDQFYWELSSEYKVNFIDQLTKSAIHIVKVEEMKQNMLYQEGNSNPLPSSSTYSSPTISSIMSRNSQNCIVIKITSYNKVSYIGMISCQSLQTNTTDPITITMINCDNKQAKKVWDMFIPVTMHCKSLEKYEDMDINIEHKGMQE